MKKNKKIIIPIVAAILFSFGFSMIAGLSEGLSPFDIAIVVFGITNLLSVLSIAYLFTNILTSNSKKSMTQLKKRLIPSFVFALLATLFIALSLYYLGNYVLFRIKGWGMENFINRIGSGAIISLSAGLFACCIVFFYATWRQAIEREQKLREENLKYRYRTLKTQVNPHFLFNSLNTLSEIVYADARKADSYIQKLSKIYRYILENEEVDLIFLDKEIKFVRQYFALQKERDENKIQLDICFENADKFKTVPISLQILVENALKHNAISEEKPLKIHIHGDDGYISVSNNIQRKSTLNNSSGTGLSNLKERVKLITGKEVIINQENNQFTVKLPLVDI
jgi:signal transduction histidine kinase